VIETGKRVSGVDKVEFAARRAGDPPHLVAACDGIRSTLKWQPRFDNLQTIVTHVLAWERRLQRPHLTPTFADPLETTSDRTTGARLARRNHD
jgi:UDP-glucose 4-epimerase